MPKISFFLGLVLSVFAASLAWSAGKSAEVTIAGMTCASCVEQIRSKFSADPAVEKATVELKRGRLTLVFKDGKNLDDAAIAKALKDDGFKAEKIVRR